MNIVRLSRDALLAPVFGGKTWDAWRTALAALFGLPIEDEELYQRCTGRGTPPAGPAREGWFVVGRRGGKSHIAALVAIYLAAFRKYCVAPGETPIVMILAANRRQARVTKRYISGLLAAHPALASCVVRETKSLVELSNGVHIETHTSDYRAVRGFTIVGCILDELAFWSTDEGSANPDTEILNALRPAMATIPNSLLVAISSPYSRRGELWRAWREHYGKDSDVLVWQAPTRTMNPTVPQRIIDRAYEEDPARAAAEYGAQFRTDIESFLSRDAIDGCVIPDRRELPPAEGIAYFGFTDPSGGSQDSFTAAVAHLDEENDVRVLDALREVRPPFSPEQTAAELAAFLKSYRVSRVTGDRYAGEWPREQFRKHGISYETSDRTKSDLYRDMLPLINSGRVELLDNPRLLAQLASLERRTARSGKDSIDHAPGGRDDVANAVAGAVTLSSRVRVVRTREILWG